MFVKKVIYDEDDILDKYPRLKVAREDIKVLFDSIRNFTIAFAFMGLVPALDRYMPSLSNAPSFKAWLMLMIVLVANFLFFANCFWLYTSSKLRNISKMRWASNLSSGVLFALLLSLWYLYSLEHIWPFIPMTFGR